MDENMDFYIPSYEGFRKGYETYNEREWKGPDLL
jgi:hypothetical protein